MMRATAASILAVCMFAAVGGRSHAAEDLAPEQAMVRQLQQAVRSDDRTWLADHARYPVNYFGGGKRVIRNRAAFIRQYRSLISAKLRAAVLAQDPADVFKNSQGLMIGDGYYNIWVRDLGDGTTVNYQIITINNGP